MAIKTKIRSIQKSDSKPFASVMPALLFRLSLAHAAEATQNSDADLPAVEFGYHIHTNIDLFGQLGQFFIYIFALFGFLQLGVRFCASIFAGIFAEFCH